MENASWAFRDVIHGRLPVSREKLAGNYRSSLTLVIFVTLLYTTVRGITVTSHWGYDVYQPEFERTLFGRTGYGIYWLSCSVLLFASLLSRGYFLWRIALLAVAVGLWNWAFLFASGRGKAVLDAVISYSAFALMFTVIAVFAHDPRPLRMMREAMEDLWIGKPSNES